MHEDHTTPIASDRAREMMVSTYAYEDEEELVGGIAFIEQIHFLAQEENWLYLKRDRPNLHG